MSAVLATQVAATLYMCGVIWFVQIVHYPLFAAVGPEMFAAYETRHRTLTTWVVAPAMLAEAFTAAWLLRSDASSVLAWTGMGLVFVIWVATAVWSVTAHGELLRGFSAAAHRRLVVTNWVRTIAWSLRAAIVLKIAGTVNA
jgi:uncharacterized membrane protein